MNSMVFWNHAPLSDHAIWFAGRDILIGHSLLFSLFCSMKVIFVVHGFQDCKQSRLITADIAKRSLLFLYKKHNIFIHVIQRPTKKFHNFNNVIDLLMFPTIAIHHVNYCHKMTFNHNLFIYHELRYDVCNIYNVK